MKVVSGPVRVSWTGMSKYKRFIRLDFGTGLLERVGTGIVGTIGYVVLPTGVSTDVSRDIV